MLSLYRSVSVSEIDMLVSSYYTAFNATTDPLLRSSPGGEFPKRKTLGVLEHPTNNVKALKLNEIIIGPKLVFMPS